MSIELKIEELTKAIETLARVIGSAKASNMEPEAKEPVVEQVEDEVESQEEVLAEAKSLCKELFAEGATKAEVKSIIIGLGAKSIKDLDIKGLRALIEKLKEPVVEQVEDEVESQEEVLAETKSLCKELFDKGIDKRDVKSIITDLGAKSIKDLDIKGLRALREKLEKIQDTIYRRDHHMSI